MARPLMSPDMGFIGQMYAAQLADQRAQEQAALARENQAFNQKMAQEQWWAQKEQLAKPTMQDLMYQAAKDAKTEAQYAPDMSRSIWGSPQNMGISTAIGRIVGAFGGSGGGRGR